MNLEGQIISVTVDNIKCYFLQDFQDCVTRMTWFLLEKVMTSNIRDVSSKFDYLTSPSKMCELKLCRLASIRRLVKLKSVDFCL